MPSRTPSLPSAFTLLLPAPPTAHAVNRVLRAVQCKRVVINDARRGPPDRHGGRWRQDLQELGPVVRYWREMARLLRPSSGPKPGVYIVVSLRSPANLLPLLAGVTEHEGGGQPSAAAAGDGGGGRPGPAPRPLWRVLHHSELTPSDAPEQSLPAHVYVCGRYDDAGKEGPLLSDVPASAAAAAGSSSLDTID